jgi:hypothetical protein
MVFGSSLLGKPDTILESKWLLTIFRERLTWGLIFFDFLMLKSWLIEVYTYLIV